MERAGFDALRLQPCSATRAGDLEQVTFLSPLAHLCSIVLGVVWLACLFLQGVVVVRFRDSESSWYKQIFNEHTLMCQQDIQESLTQETLDSQNV